MKLKHAIRMALIALVIAWIFDQLFWKKTPGISIFLFIAAYIAGLIYTTFNEGGRPIKSTFLLLAPIFYFSIMFFVRLEPFTSFINLLLILTSLVILTLTWLGGNWFKYSLSDYLVRSTFLGGSLIAAPLQVFLQGKYQLTTVDEAQDIQVPKKTGANRKWLFSIILGLFLALPVVIIMGALLAAADPIFQKQLTDLLNLLSIDKTKEYIFRTFIILIVAYLILGGYLFSLLHSREEKLIGLDKPWLPTLFNWVTSGIILLSVDILFISFVVVQFRYFFGGQVNISYEGFTYADYARKGFGELVSVAFLSLVLFLGLGMLTQRTSGWGRKIYSTLGIGLVLLVGVMLISAFQRLYLYEEVYGFSRIRTYTYVFMIWLGILLALTVVLELFNHLRGFALAAFLVSLGFGISLGILNVDGFISRQNVSNAIQGHPLDIPYLVSLSEDATPDLFNLYHDDQIAPSIRSQLGGILACRSVTNSSKRSNDWAAFRWAIYRSDTLYQQYAQDLKGITPYLKNGGWYLSINGSETPCQSGYFNSMSPE